MFSERFQCWKRRPDIRCSNDILYHFTSLARQTAKAKFQSCSIRCCALAFIMQTQLHVQFLIRCTLAFLRGPRAFLSIKKNKFCALTCLTTTPIQMTADIWHTGWVALILADDFFFSPPFQHMSHSHPFVRPWTRFSQKAYVLTLPLSLPPRCAPFIHPFCQTTGICSRSQPH